MAEPAKFTFQCLDGKKYISLENKDIQETLLKWSMKNRIKAQTFCFDQRFQSYQKNDFVQAFFQDPNVLRSLQVVSDSAQWCSLGVKAKSVSAEQLPCTILNMNFFDRLLENNVIRESGHIMKCFDEFIGDFTISDELRKMLVDEDSDNFDVYSEAERDEFLFRLFRHFCLGGAVCQYEDVIKPYLDITKQLYKELVTVQKDPATSDVHITSVVLKVSALGDDGSAFYPSDRDHDQDFAYFVIDVLKRHVTVLYHRFGTCVFES